MVSRISTITARFNELSLLTRGLMILAAAQVLIGVAQYVVFKDVTSLLFTRHFLVFHRIAADDSWRPMQLAWQYFLSGGSEPLYTAVFFEQGVKFQYPPLSLLLVAPFARLPYDPETSNYWLQIVSWFVMLATMPLMAKLLETACRTYIPEHPINRHPERLLGYGLVAFLTITFFPIVHSYHLGQIQVWINFLFCAVVLAWMTDRKALAGLIAAALCIMKPQFVLLLLWGGLRKEWRFAGWFAAAGIVCAAVSVAVFGIENHLDYVKLLSFLSRYGESLSINQSINGVLNRLFDTGPVTHEAYTVLYFAGPLKWVPAYNIWVYLGTLLSTLLLVGLALFWRSGEHRGASTTDLMIAALTFTVASPIAWTHHYGVLLPMFVVALPATLRQSEFGRGSVLLLVVAYVLTANFFKGLENLHGTLAEPVVSSFLAGVLLFLWHLYRLRHAQYRNDSAQFVLTPTVRAT